MICVSSPRYQRETECSNAILLAWHGIGNEVGNRGHGQRSEGSGPPFPAEAPGQTEASPEFDSGRKGCDTKVFDNKYPETEQLRNDMYDKLYIYNLSYLLLSFTKYKYTVYTGMYFHQNTSYQTQSFPYQTTTQWWNRAKRRRSARDPRPQVLPSHADPPPPSVDSSNPMNNSKYLLAPWNTWRRKQNRKESNTTSKPKVLEFLRGIKHQTNIVENSQFYKNFQKVSTKGGKCTSTPPEPYTENPQYSDNKRNRLPAFKNANTVQWSSKTLHTSNQPQGTKSRPQDHPVKRDLSGIHMKTLPKPPMSTLENLAPEPLRFAQNIPNNTHKVRIWKIGPHADQTACHMPRRLITNKPCFCLSQKILPTVTPRRGFHSTHSADISSSWDVCSPQL